MLVFITDIDEYFITKYTPEGIIYIFRCYFSYHTWCFAIFMPLKVSIISEFLTAIITFKFWVPLVVFIAFNIFSGYFILIFMFSFLAVIISAVYIFLI